MKSLISKTYFLATAFILAIPTLTMAGGPGFNPNVNDGCAAVPLDGGLSILAAAGIGYTAKKVLGNRKKNTEPAK